MPKNLMKNKQIFTFDVFRSKFCMDDLTLDEIDFVSISYELTSYKLVGGNNSRAMLESSIGRSDASCRDGLKNVNKQLTF